MSAIHCPDHPDADLVRDVGAVNKCATCSACICQSCGEKDAGSWMSGYCNSCYRVKSREWEEQRRERDYNSAAARGWDDACERIAQGESHPEIATVYKRRNPFREAS